MPELAPFPLWNQLDDWTTDPDRGDENAPNNCGPEAVAMCLKYLTGIELPADFIKDVMLGPEAIGVTTADHLIKFLREKCEIDCRFIQEWGLQFPIIQAIDDGNPVIVLLNAEPPGPIGHWAPVIGYDPLLVRFADPLGGRLIQYYWSVFDQFIHRGVAVRLLATRHLAAADARGPHHWAAVQRLADEALRSRP